MDATTLIGYFTKRDEARKVFRELQRRGFHRAAMVSRTADGRVDTWDPLPWRRVLGATVAFILFGSVAAISVITLEWPEPIERGIRHAVLPILAGGLLGVLNSDADEYLKTGGMITTSAALSDEAINRLVQQRLDAREQRNWAAADAIRDQLTEQGVVLEDRSGSGSTEWRRVSG